MGERGLLRLRQPLQQQSRNEGKFQQMNAANKVRILAQVEVAENVLERHNFANKQQKKNDVIYCDQYIET